MKNRRIEQTTSRTAEVICVSRAVGADLHPDGETLPSVQVRAAGN